MPFLFCHTRIPSKEIDNNPLTYSIKISNLLKSLTSNCSSCQQDRFFTHKNSSLKLFLQPVVWDAHPITPAPIPLYSQKFLNPKLQRSCSWRLLINKTQLSRWLLQKVTPFFAVSHLYLLDFVLICTIPWYLFIGSLQPLVLLSSNKKMVVVEVMREGIHT